MSIFAKWETSAPARLDANSTMYLRDYATNSDVTEKQTLPSPRTNLQLRVPAPIGVCEW
jgi:hypothetical protein